MNLLSDKTKETMKLLINLDFFLEKTLLEESDLKNKIEDLKTTLLESIPLNEIENAMLAFKAMANILMDSLVSQTFKGKN